MAPFTLRNRFIAPTFENGVNGWTVQGLSGGTGTLSASTTYSQHGTKSLKLTIPAGSGTVRLIPPSFPIIENPYRMFALSFSALSTTGGAVYYGFERFKPVTLALHNDSVVGQPLTTEWQKFGKMDYLAPDNAPYIGGELPKIYVYQNPGAAQTIYFDGFTWFDAADQEFYPFGIDPAMIPQVSGSWASDDNYSYSWTGAAEASASIATFRSELFVPPAFNRGDIITVTGTGFPASSTVDIVIGEHWNRPPAAIGVPTDASGNLSTTLEAPYAHDPGNAYIVGKPANGAVGSMMRQEVWTNPSDPSRTITNYFPNPNGQTLAADGVTPKYFGPTYYEGDVVTRAIVDGVSRIRFDGEYGNMGIDIAESGNSIGLVDGKQYILRARLQSSSVPTDRWAYLQSSDGASDNALVGASPWELAGIGTGTFDGPLELISSGWGEGIVDIDHMSVIEAATYLVSWSGDMPMAPGSSLDGYKIGLRPGRDYQLAGYTYGTFKIRTGTSPETLSDLLAWNNVNPDEWTGGAVQYTLTIPDGHTTIQLEASGAGESYVSIHDYVPYFDGDTPDGGGFTYSWAGTPNDSPSIRSIAAAGPTAQVFVGGTAKTVSEIRVVKEGILIPITELGG